MKSSPWTQLSLEVLYMPLCAELYKERRENFDTNPDQIQNFMICGICSITKSYNKVSHVLFG